MRAEQKLVKPKTLIEKVKYVVDSPYRYNT